MMAGGYDTLTVYKESAPCPNRSVLLVQGDHRDNGWSVFLRKVGDGFLRVSTLCEIRSKVQMMEAMEERLFILRDCEHGQSRTLNTDSISRFRRNDLDADTLVMVFSLQG